MIVASDKAKSPNYHPPWTGRKGAEYGPRSSSEYARQIADHNNSIEGGGLYDKAEDPKHVLRKEEHSQERYDLEPMTAFVERASTRIGKRMLEVFYLYWRDGKSLSNTARIMLEQRGIEGLSAPEYRKALARCKVTTKRQINDLRKMLALRKSPW